MTLFKQYIKYILVKISGNRFIQAWLRENVYISQYLMGIGSGSDVSTSGEDEVFRVLTKMCNAPYCVFDVGANKGQFLSVLLDVLPLSDLVIHCFEPGKMAYNELAKSTNMANDINLNNIGLGKEKSQSTLYYDEAGVGSASLTKRNLNHFGVSVNESEEVMIDTIDSYCAEHSVRRINLLKIDVEGHELDVLLGARKMLSLYSIDIVLFEFGGCNIDTRIFFQDFWYYFMDHHMKLYRVTPSGYMVHISEYEEMNEQFRATNFVAMLG